MAQSGIPTDIENFISDHIDSLDVLEVLLFLCQRSTERWTALQVARELRMNDGQAVRRLDELADDNLVIRDPSSPNPTYQFAPTDGRLRDTVSRLEQVYRERRVGVITLIFSKPNEKIRTFADAFKFRRDK